MTRTYVNRYGDEFKFTPDEDGNLLWEGNFEYYRCGYSNDYSKAYKAYLKDTPLPEAMSLADFETKVHEYDTGNKCWVMEPYLELVESNQEVLNMVDPSGGPYITEGHNAGLFNKECEGKIVQEFKSIPTGYKIILK